MKKLFLWTLTFSWAGYTFYLTTIPDFHPSGDSFISWILSNGGHFFFFGVLAALIYLSLNLSFHLRSTKYVALTTSSLYGLAIEFIQFNIPGRSFDLKDWGMDTLGAIIFLMVLTKYRLRKV